jgi:NAD/NADP transhydrogenase alpha subunit
MGTVALNVLGSVSNTASARIVVQATEHDKRAIAAKAKKLDLPISELMRRGAFAYESADVDAEFGALAIAAETAAQRSAGFIDEALDFIAASNQRIKKMEDQAAKAHRKNIKTKAA